MEFALVIPDYDNKYKYFFSEISLTENMQKKKTPSDKQIFQYCLEVYLQTYEGAVALPRAEDEWLLVKGATQEEIKSGKYTVMRKLSRKTMADLWELYQWVDGPVTGLRIVADY